MTKPTSIAIAICFWAALFTAAFFADQPLAQWAHHTRPLANLPHHLIPILKFPGDFRFTASLAFLLVVANVARWQRGVLLLLSGIIGGLFYTLIKWAVGRYRPFKDPDTSTLKPFIPHPFRHGFAGLFNEPNQSFPSGHGTLAFATAAALGLLFPKWRWLFYPLAAVVAAERILESAHYPSDAVGAALVGWLAAHLALHLCRRWTLNPIQTKIRHEPHPSIVTTSFEGRS